MPTNIPWLELVENTFRDRTKRTVYASIKIEEWAGGDEGMLLPNQHVIRGAVIHQRELAEHKIATGDTTRMAFIQTDYLVTVSTSDPLKTRVATAVSSRDGKEWSIRSFFYSLRKDKGPWITAAMKKELARTSTRTLPGVVMEMLCEGLTAFPELSDDWSSPTFVNDIRHPLNSEDLQEAAATLPKEPPLEGLTLTGAQLYLTKRYHRLFPGGGAEDWDRYVRMTKEHGYYGAWQNDDGAYVRTNTSFADMCCV